MKTFVFRCPKCSRVYKLKFKQRPRCDCGLWTQYSETIDEIDHKAKMDYYWSTLKAKN